jgi:hypothetical protein
MRAAFFIAFLVASAGCVQDGCLGCDDGNPCTSDRCQEGSCVHSPQTGPIEGCSGAGGCVEYGCFSGQCLPQRRMGCCGNGDCEPAETFTACPRDCLATCDDGMANQGEEAADCGGPCPPCGTAGMGGMKRLEAARTLWYASATNYTEAVKAYNADRNSSLLRSRAITSYNDVENEMAALARLPPQNESALLARMLNLTMASYLGAIHNMVMYSNSGDDSYRIRSNRLLADSFDRDREFAIAYNSAADSYNTVQTGCFDGVRDQGEESADCGGPCQARCAAVYNVTKYVLVRNEGGPARVSLNVTSPAVDYPPMQRLLSSDVRPRPDMAVTVPEGTRYYSWEFDMPAYGVREFEVTETVRLYRTEPYSQSDSRFFADAYVVEGRLSQMTDDICFRAGLLAEGANGTRDKAQRIYSWLRDNVEYELNGEEMGASSCFARRRGACDEHADLFVSMARCDGVPARRVTGSLVNGTRLSGHAWSEYYAGGWVYLDPSVKKSERAFVPDNRHVTACLGEGAYECGVGYSYTYSGKAPTISVKEQVYLN